jgi:hypothetical protein
MSELSGQFDWNAQPKWTKLPALAERLGVKPLGENEGFREVVLEINKVGRYDLLDLVNALLDRLDALRLDYRA